LAGVHVVKTSNPVQLSKLILKSTLAVMTKLLSD